MITPRIVCWDCGKPINPKDKILVHQDGYISHKKCFLSRRFNKSKDIYGISETIKMLKSEQNKKSVSLGKIQNKFEENNSI